jgi:hypothetical protein
MNSLLNYQSQMSGEFFQLLSSRQKASKAVTTNTTFFGSNNFQKLKNFNIMKPLKGLITVLLVSIVTFAYSNSPIVQFAKADGTKVLVQLTSGNTATISIKTATGLSLYNEIIRNDGKVKQYELSALAAGKYTVSVELSDRIIEQTLEITTNGVALLDSETLLKPKFTATTNALSIKIPAAQKNVEVAIFDESGHVLHQERTKATAFFNKKYLLHQLPNGRYNVSVTAESGSYNCTVEVKK